MEHHNLCHTICKNYSGASNNSGRIYRNEVINMGNNWVGHDDLVWTIGQTADSHYLSITLGQRIIALITVVGKGTSGVIIH